MTRDKKIKHHADRIAESCIRTATLAALDDTLNAAAAEIQAQIKQAQKRNEPAEYITELWNIHAHTMNARHAITTARKQESNRRADHRRVWKELFNDHLADQKLNQAVTERLEADAQAQEAAARDQAEQERRHKGRPF